MEIPRVAEQLPHLNIRPLACDIDEETVANLLMNRLWHRHHRRFDKADRIRDALAPFVEIMDDAEGTLWMWRPVGEG